MLDELHSSKKAKGSQSMLRLLFSDPDKDTKALLDEHLKTTKGNLLVFQFQHCYHNLFPGMSTILAHKGVIPGTSFRKRLWFSAYGKT